MNARRVAITGFGVISALGIGRDTFSRRLTDGRSGLAELTLFDVPELPLQLVGELPPFDVEDYVLAPKTYLDRAAEAALAAMWLAVDDAGLEHQGETIRQAGMSFGTATGSLPTAELFFEGVLDKGPRYAKPLLFPHAYSNTAASLLAVEYKLSGPHLNFADGAVSGATAVLAGYDAIKGGHAEMMFAGGVEVFSESLLQEWHLQGLLSETAVDRGGITPYGPERDGTALGEAAVVLVLEEINHARRRNATVYAEIAGAGTAGEAGPATTASCAGDTPSCALVRAMRMALQEADCDVADLGLIIAGANGSVRGDRHESLAFAQLYADSPVAVTTVRPMTGETYGASGPLQIAAALAAFDAARIPATLNAQVGIPEAPACLVRETEPLNPADAVLATATDPGGSAVAVVIEKCSTQAVGE